MKKKGSGHERSSRAKYCALQGTSSHCKLSMYIVILKIMFLLDTRKQSFTHGFEYVVVIPVRLNLDSLLYACAVYSIVLHDVCSSPKL